MIDFGDWMPDQPSMNAGVSRLENGAPAARGFRSVNSPVQVTDADRLFSAYTFNGFNVPGGTVSMDRIRGLISTVAVSSGTLSSNIFVGTETALYKLDVTSNRFSPWNYDAATAPAQQDPTYSGVKQWQFAEFATTGGARYVYAAGGPGQILQRFPSNGSAAPTDVSGAPNATHVAAISRFLVCGNTSGSEAQIVWSEIDAAENWGSSNQAGNQVLADTDEVTGIVGGESGLILTRKGLYRMNYVGPPLVFTFERVANRGCDFAGSVASLSSDQVFFLSEDGFQFYNAGRVQNISSERITRFFFSDFDRSRSADLSCVSDPTSDQIIWSYASKTASGTNDTLLFYNYVLDKWGIARTPHDFVGFSRQVGKTLEQLDDPNTTVTFAGSVSAQSALNLAQNGASNLTSLDDMTVSLDSARFAGGSSFLTLAVTRGGACTLNELAGSVLPLTVETGEFEAAPGHFVLVNGLMPHIDAADATIKGAVGARNRQTDELRFGELATVNATNYIPSRKSGRYFRGKFTATGNWSHAYGFQVDAKPQGRR